MKEIWNTQFHYSAWSRSLHAFCWKCSWFHMQWDTSALSWGRLSWVHAMSPNVSCKNTLTHSHTLTHTHTHTLTHTHTHTHSHHTHTQTHTHTLGLIHPHHFLKAKILKLLFVISHPWFNSFPKVHVLVTLEANFCHEFPTVMIDLCWFWKGWGLWVWFLGFFHVWFLFVLLPSRMDKEGLHQR